MTDLVTVTASVPDIGSTYTAKVGSTRKVHLLGNPKAFKNTLKP